MDVLKRHLQLLLEGFFISVVAVISRCVVLHDGQVSLPILNRAWIVLLFTGIHSIKYFDIPFFMMITNPW